jgi:hypothetical protein
MVPPHHRGKKQQQQQVTSALILLSKRGDGQTVSAHIYLHGCGMCDPLSLSARSKEIAFLLCVVTIDGLAS